MIINYTESGTAHPDCMCELVIKVAVGSGTERLDVSTENIIKACRYLIATGEIKHDAVEFHMDGHCIGGSNEVGMLQCWPKGFCDYNDKWLRGIVTSWATSKI